MAAEEFDLSTLIRNVRYADVRASAVHGNVNTATRALPSRTLLAALDGQRVPWDVYAANRGHAGEWNALPGDVLLVRPFRTQYYYFNHARDANCRVVRVGEPTADGTPEAPFVRADGTEWRAESAGERACAVLVVTSKPIAKGDELTLDYREEPLPSAYVTGHGATYL